MRSPRSSACWSRATAASSPRSWCGSMQVVERRLEEAARRLERHNAAVDQRLAGRQRRAERARQLARRVPVAARVQRPRRAKRGCDHGWSRRARVNRSSGMKCNVSRYPLARAGSRFRADRRLPRGCKPNARPTAPGAHNNRVSRKPNSVGLLRGDHLTGTRVSARLMATDPGVITRRVTPLPLYAVLLQVGFTEPAPSPGPLVRSYRTVSPLPAACRPLSRTAHARWRSALCCTFRGLAPPGSYPAPCPVEFGLSSTGSLGHRLRGGVGVPAAITWETRNPGLCRASDSPARRRARSARAAPTRNAPSPMRVAACRASACSGFRPACLTRYSPVIWRTTSSESMHTRSVGTS